MSYDLDSEYVKDFLKEWFNGGNRQLGIKRDIHTDDFNVIMRYIKQCVLKGEPAFHSIQAQRTITKIFWEFDFDTKFEGVKYNSPELIPVWDEAMRLVKRLKKAGATPLITYSGNRGYHVWVYIEDKIGTFTAKTENVGRTLYKALVYQFLGDRDTYKYFDRVPTNVNTMARIPFSYHQKTGNQVIPLDENRNPYYPKVSDIKDNALPVEFAKTKLPGIIREIARLNALRESMKDKPKGESKVRPYVLEAMYDPKATHNTRLAFVMDAIYADYSDEDIHKIFEETVEHYDYDKTQYNIDYQRRRAEEGMRPTTNKTLSEWGIKIPKRRDLSKLPFEKSK